MGAWFGYHIPNPLRFLRCLQEKLPVMVVQVRDYSSKTVVKIREVNNTHASHATGMLSSLERLKRDSNTQLGDHPFSSSRIIHHIKNPIFSRSSSIGFILMFPVVR